MTGPEHYREAERLIDSLNSVMEGSAKESGILAEAQVHATLALAAATAMAAAGPDGMALVDFRAWDTAAGVPTQPATQPATQEG